MSNARWIILSTIFLAVIAIAFIAFPKEAKEDIPPLQNPNAECNDFYDCLPVHPGKTGCGGCSEGVPELCYEYDPDLCKYYRERYPCIKGACI